MERQATPVPSEKGSLHVPGLSAICFGFFMVILDTSVVNVALPAMQHDLHGSLEGLQWVVNSYTLVFASLLLSAGTLGDRLGHKRAFLTGYVLFAGASLLCSLTPSLSVLVAARALQGVGPAFLVPSSLSLISHAFHDPGKRARAVGIWGGVRALGWLAVLYAYRAAACRAAVPAGQRSDLNLLVYKDQRVAQAR